MLRTHGLVPGPVLVLALLVAVCSLTPISPARGQAGPESDLKTRPEFTRATMSSGLPLRLSSQRGPSPALPASPQTGDDSRFAKAVLGSTLGAVVGGALGGLLIAAAPDDEDRSPFRDDENRPESLAVLLIASGPPTGAVLYTDIRRDHPGSYMMALIGELALGGGGVALEIALGGDSKNGQLAGALGLGIPGVVLGAAGGAVLGAPDRPGATGALSYADGNWTVGLPTLHPGVHLQPEPGLHGRVSIVTVDL